MNQTLYLGDRGSGKTHALISHFEDWLRQGVPSHRIVAVTGHRRQHAAAFCDALLNRWKQPVGELNLWVLPHAFQELILAHQQLLADQPLHCLQSSELLFLMRYFHRQAGADYFEVPANDTAFFQHLLRRYLRCSENLLWGEALTQRTRQLEVSPQAEAANAFLQAFTAWLRTEKPQLLDLRSQIEALTSLLDQPRVQQFLSGYTHWLIDDLDETRPFEQLLLQALTRSAEAVIWAGNPQGGTERLLGAYPDFVQQLAQQPGIQTQQLPARAPLALQAQGIRAALLGTPGAEAPPALQLSWYQDMHQMYAALVAQVQQALAEGLSLDQIVCVTWALDAFAARQLQQHFAQTQIPVQIYRGREPLPQEPLLNALLSLLRLVLWPLFQADARLPPLRGLDMLQIMALCTDLSPFERAELMQQHGDDLKAWGAWLQVAAATRPDIAHLQETTSQLRARYATADVADLYAVAEALWQQLLAPRQAHLSPEIQAGLQQLFEILSRHALLALPGSAQELLLQLLNQYLMTDAELRDGTLPHLRIMTLYRLCELRHVSTRQIWFDLSSASWEQPVNHPLDNALLLSPAWPLDQSWSLLAEEHFTRERLAALVHKGLQYGQTPPLLLAARYDAQARPQPDNLLTGILAAENC